MRPAFMTALLATLLLTSGCLLDLGHGQHRGSGHGHFKQGPGHGPPAHARAHGRGHRHGSDHTDLTFDSSLGVYLVGGLPNHYFLDGHYLRLEKGQWLISVDLEGPWHPHAVKKLPPGLRAKHGRSHPAKRGKSKGRGW